MSIPRHYETLTLLPSGKVLTVGTNTEPAPLSRKSCELFDESTGSWAPTGDTADYHDGAAVVRLESGKVLAAGGYDLLAEGSSSFTVVPTATAELFDENGNDGRGTWATTGSLPDPYIPGGGVLLPSGQVLLVGGADGSSTARSLATTLLYDPSSGTFTPTTSMSSPRQGASVTRLLSGKVLVVGGCIDDFWTCTRTTSTELYDPDTGSWSSAGSTAPVFNHVAVLLGDGRVLVAGGCAGGNAHNTCVLSNQASIYDPGTNEWSTASSMHHPRAGLVATWLPAVRQVLVTGGTWDYPSSSEVYDPDSDRWSYGPPTRYDHGFGPQASPLESGGWLVAGGALTDRLSSSAEIFRER